MPRQAELGDPRPHLQVVAGIVTDERGRILIAERLCDGPFDGLWEFPGGKIVPGEASNAALVRELDEELGIAVIASEPFMALNHDYPDRRVSLEFFRINQWTGEPRGLEGQRIRWVAPARLDASMLLPADKPVVERLQQMLS